MIDQEQIDTINDELDPIADQSFDSWEAAWQAISLILEGQGIEVPAVSNFSDEMVFKLELGEEEAQHYLYVATEDQADDDKYTMYATIASEAELDVIEDIGDDDVPEDDV